MGPIRSLPGLFLDGYLAVALIVLILAIVVFFANIPDLAAGGEQQPKNPELQPLPGSIWARGHFVGGVGAQFFYVAAQAGIFSFFINYVVTEVPAISPTLIDSWLLRGGAVLRDGGYFINEQGATRLLGVAGFGLFLAGRFIGTGLLRKFPAHCALGVYGIINAALCGIVVLKFGWISFAAVLLSFFFMSIMFPTIFALGIHGLGAQAKKPRPSSLWLSWVGRSYQSLWDTLEIATTCR